MDDLVRSLRRFIARDAIFIIGGSAVVLSFCYAFDRLWILDMPKPLYLVAAGFAYVLGYVIQDGAGLIRLITPAHSFSPWPIARTFYRLHTKREWQEIAPFDGEEALLQIERAAVREGGIPEATLARLERVVALRQVGNTLGPCCLVSFGFLVYRAGRFVDPFDTALAIAVLGVGIVLLMLGWLKGAQQVELVHRLKA